MLKDGKSAMIHLATADCTGVEANGNCLYGGSGRFVSGKGVLLSSEGNQALPLLAGPRPQPRVPSIYDWQQEHCTK